MFTTLLLRELHYHLLTYRFALSAVLLSVLVVGSSLVLGLLAAYVGFLRFDLVD